MDYDILGRGSAQDLFDEQCDVRDMLRAQHQQDEVGGTEWVIISTGIFTSFLFELSFGVVGNFTPLLAGIGGGGASGSLEGEEDEETSSPPIPMVRALGSWDTRVTVTSVEGIGRLTAAILTASNPRVANEVVHVAGDTISYQQLADIVEKAVPAVAVVAVADRGTGKREGLRRELWSTERLREELRMEPGDSVRKYRVVFAEGRGVAWEVEGMWGFRRGVEGVGVDEWVRGMVGRK